MTPKYRILPIGGGGVTPSGSLTITENGVYDVTQYEEVNVNANPSWLCFTALENNSSVGITIANQYTELYYTFDGVNSTRWYGDSITLNEGDKVYVFGKAGNNAKIGQFNMTGTISASGDITSLLNGVGGTNNVTLYRYVFQDLFSGCLALVKAPRIDMITSSILINNSDAGRNLFNKMFYNTGLTEIPKLPHIFRDLPNVAYIFDNMFGMCSSLPAKPDLSYIDSKYCFPCETQGMFEGSSIEELDLRGITNVSRAYQYKRTFRGMPNLTSVDLSNLTSITAINYSMEECFKDCSNLNTIKIGVISTWDQYKTYNWLNSVAQTGDFYNLGNNTTIPVNNSSGIPTGWRNIISERTPTVTSGVSSITSTSAVGTISIQDAGGATITRAGICWSTSSNPTVNSTHVDLTLPVSEGESYQVELNNLTGDTTYYLRSYAQNQVGLSYSDSITFVTADSTINYMCLTSLSTPSAQISMEHNGTNATTTKPVIYYSTDGVNFTNWDYSTIYVSEGSSVYFYGDNPNGVSYANTDYDYGNNYSRFRITGAVQLSGDITTLIRQQGQVTELPAMAFVSLFENSHTSGTADFSSVTRVNDGALMRSFQDTEVTGFDLSNLEYIDVHGMHAAFARSYISGNVDLHSLTTVKDTGMWACFYTDSQITNADLSSLTTVDTTGDNGPLALCFYYNRNLNNIKIGMTYWNNWSFENWTETVSSTGDFYNLGGAQIPTGANGIPNSWVEHTSL